MVNKLLNPIEFYNDRKLLIFNGFIFLLGSLLCVGMKSWFIGMLTMLFRNEINFYKTTLENVLSIVILFLIVFIAGKIINKKTRAIDCLNLVMFSRIPLYIFSSINFLGTLSKSQSTDNLSTTDTILLNLSLFLNLIVFVYLLVLYYRSFTTITNAKDIKHYFVLVIFIFIGLIVSPSIIKLI